MTKSRTNTVVRVVIPTHDARLIADWIESHRDTALPTSYPSIDALLDALRKADR